MKLAEDAVEQRGLAAAVRADDAEDLTLVHVERHAFDRMDAAEVLGKIANFQHGGHVDTFASRPGVVGGLGLRATAKRRWKSPMMPLGLNTNSTMTKIA